MKNNLKKPQYLIDNMESYYLRILINIFICIMLFWMLVWDSEKNNPLRVWFLPLIQKQMIWLGLSHDWKMFSPNPSMQNTWPMIKLYKEDGNFVVWEQGKTSEMSIFEKLKYKKYLKFYLAVARAKKNIYTKIDFIEFLIRQHDLNESCIKAEVYRVHQNIPEFESVNPPDLKIYKKLIYTYTPKSTSNDKS